MKHKLPTFLLVVLWLNPFVKLVFGQTNSSGDATMVQSEIEGLMSQAEAERKTSRYNNSRKLLDSALLLDQLSDSKFFAGMIYTELGLVSMYQSNYSDALRYFQAGLLIRQQQKDSALLAESYNYIAAVHQIQGNYETAADYYGLSLEMTERTGSKRDLGMVTNNLGSLYEDLADYGTALKYHERSLSIWKSIQDSSWVSVSLRHIGQCYRNQGDLDNALEAFQQSYQISKKLGTRLNIIYVAQAMGLLYFQKGQLDEALKWLDLSYNLAVEEDNLVKIHEGASGLAKVYEKLDSCQQAFKFHKIAVELKDSIFGKEKIKELTQLELSYQFEKEQLADSLQFVRTSLIQEKQISNQRIGLVSVGIITIIMFILAGVVYHGKQKSDNLLLNILPSEVAEELKSNGSSQARKFNDVTVIFTDFKGFTHMSEELSPEYLVAEIHHCFSAFDAIITKYGLEKIKTIGDAYMAASGLPKENERHAIVAVKAALEMSAYMKERKLELDEKDKKGFEMRVGIHSGSVIAGIVGTKKFQYDIWGDTVNTAARMESSGEIGKVNVSKATYELVKGDFECTYRGRVEAKGKGQMEMYFVESKQYS